MKNIEMSEIMVNIHGEEAEIHENEDGSATVWVWGKATQMASVEDAVERLWKKGFRF